MGKPGGYPQGGQEPYYGERRAPLPANQHFSDRSYEDYGQPQQAWSSVTSEASVDATISCMASMKIGDDRSALVISQGLYTPQ
ncbi:hypothetical protein F8M41_010589 [Gigaspora margarita]|uniref:Uncharacterized protein n=1 Tax=Gigaspora margarita TaxID=4874 RepID=A0A8H3X1I2_GIGMA|nr:hypothetical protein F8M41_010589 [Gigaspora margarita]